MTCTLFDAETETGIKKRELMHNIGFIFARGGSKGVPMKNIKLLGGKPLICHAIETARDCPSIDRIVVSTDDARIAKIAETTGAEVPFIRPSALAKDDAPEWLAWRHAVDFLKKEGTSFDLFISIPTTSPFRKVEDIENCIQLFRQNAGTDVVITVTPAQRHPSFNMVTLDTSMTADLAAPLDQVVFRRQDTSRMYDITTVAYVVRPEFILTANSIFEGNVKAVVVPRARALDIDSPFDFKIAELLIKDMEKI